MAERPAAKPVAHPESDWETVQPDEWQTVSGQAAPATEVNSLPQMAKTTGQAIGKFGSNALQGIGESILGSLGELGDITQRHLFPEAVRNSAYGKDYAEGVDTLREMAQPESNVQTGGKMAGNVAQFFVPGEAEESAVSATPAFLRPAARIATSALSSGGVNAAQGGGFGIGAAAGGIGAGAGELMRMAAPATAETALHIGHAQRGFGKTPGKAALELTRGVRPETILSSGRESMENLMRDLESHVDAASIRPYPKIAGFLEPPQETVELARKPAIEPKEHPMTYRAESHRGTPRVYNQVQFQSGGAHPELSGRVEQPQGTMTHTPEMSASIPPLTEPAAKASLRPARQVLGGAIGKARANEAGDLHNQLQQMQDFLHQGRVSGEPIPENVTPRRLLNLKRGFSEEHLRWNPNIHQEATNAGRRAYGALDQELDRTVPSARATNQRVSSLIEVLRNADRESRMAGAGQRMLGRFGAHTGALFGVGPGAYVGYREGGAPGAVVGGAMGVLAPELISSPEGQMAVARMMHGAGNLRPLTAAALASHSGGKR